MRSTWIVLGGIAALLLAAGTVSAAQETRTFTQRIEVAPDEGSAQPQVRIWVNGKEVKPGESLELPGIGIGGDGSLRIEGMKDLKDLKDLRAERGQRQAPPPYLGVMVGPAGDNEAGTRVNAVMPGGPAAEAGLTEGDLITRLGDVCITDPQQFVDLVRGHKPGDAVTIKWTRDGKQMEKRVTLTAMPEAMHERIRREEGMRKEEASTDAYLGVIAAPLTEDIKKLAGTDRGVLINSLPDSSPAAQAGLLPGDVITAVDGKAVAAPGDLGEIVLGHKPGDTLRIDYFRSGKQRTAEVKLVARPPAEEHRRHGGAGALEAPEGMLEQVPELKGYMDQLRRWLEQGRARRGGEVPVPMPMPNMPIPGQPPEVPQAPHRAPYVLPVPPQAPAPRMDSYDVGKDIGKILERLDRLDKRLGDIERRLDRIEKKP